MDLSTDPNAECRKTSGGWCWPHGKFCDDPSDEVTIDLVGCARCDGDGHRNLTFKKFMLPAGEDDEWTHWATCPMTGEPILMGFFDEDDEDEEDESCDVCGNVSNKADGSRSFCSKCMPPIVADESVPEGQMQLLTCTCGVTAIKTWELVHAPSCPCS